MVSDAGWDGASGDADSFLVSVSLDQYFIDERARCYMQADRKRRVAWLARRLRRTFALPARPALLLRGHLLPPGEPLAMLAPGDALRAIPASARVADLSRKRAAAAGSEEGAAAGGKRGRRGPQPLFVPELSDNTQSAAPPSPEPSDDTPAALPSPAAADDTLESLVEMKRRALDLLESRQREAAPRRRRRVRRRTRLHHQSAEDMTHQNAEQMTHLNAEQTTHQNPEQMTHQNAEQMTQQNTEQMTQQNTEQMTQQNTEQMTQQNTEQMSQQMDQNAEQVMDVIRNECERERAPRCVSALSSLAHSPMQETLAQTCIK